MLLVGMLGRTFVCLFVCLFDLCFDCCFDCFDLFLYFFLFFFLSFFLYLFISIYIYVFLIYVFYFSWGGGLVCFVLIWCVFVLCVCGMHWGIRIHPEDCRSALWYTLLYHTPPKFNIASEKWWLEDYFPIGKVTFQGYVKLREGSFFNCLIGFAMSWIVNISRESIVVFGRHAGVLYLFTSCFFLQISLYTHLGKL